MASVTVRIKGFGSVHADDLNKVFNCFSAVYGHMFCALMPSDTHSVSAQSTSKLGPTRAIFDGRLFSSSKHIGSKTVKKSQKKGLENDKKYLKNVGTLIFSFDVFLLHATVLCKKHRQFVALK